MSSCEKNFPQKFDASRCIFLQLPYLSCISSPHWLAGGARLKTATCQVERILFSCTGLPWPPEHQHHHPCQDVPLVTFPHHMFPSYVTTLTQPQKEPKERFERPQATLKMCPDTHWSQMYLQVGESIPKTVRICRSLSWVCKHILPRLHFLRLPLVMRNSQPAQRRFSAAPPPLYLHPTWLS